MKVELNDIIKELKAKYDTINNDYVDACAVDYMSRRATYLDGQCAILHEIITNLEDINEDAVVDEIVDSMFDEEDFALEEEYAFDEVGYDPYTGGYDMDL